MKNTIKRMLSMVILVVLLAQPIFVHAAEFLQPKTVRVGFFSFDGYHMMDENGKKSGYGYEYLQHMAINANFVYEYVGYDQNWSKMQEMLENGEIDILTSAQKTEDRLEKFDFSDQAIGTSATILTTKAGNQQYKVEDYENWDGIRIGILDGNSRNDSFAAFAEEKGFTYQPVVFQDTEEMLNELHNGFSIDAVVTSNLRAIKGEWVLARMDASPFYVMVKKGNTKLLEDINRAIEQVTANESYLQESLWNKYYSADSGSEIFYTTEEREYIEAMKGTEFTALLSPDRAPLTYFENGVPSGIIYDIISEIITRTGLNVKITETKNRKEYSEYCNNNKADIRLDTWYNLSEAEAQGYKLINPYLSASVSCLKLENNRNSKSIAALRDSDITNKYVSKLDGMMEIAYYDTTAEVVEAIRSGKQDIAYLYTKSAEQVVIDDITGRLMSERLFGYDMQFTIGVSNQQNYLLASIFNKASESLSEGEIAYIVQSYTSETTTAFSIIKYVYDYPVLAVAIAVCLFIIITLAAMFVFGYKRRILERRRVLDEARKNELLRDALSAAQHSEASRGVFLSKVSHEMRTPLNAIIGYMALAKDEEVNLEQVKDYIVKSDSAARQLLAIINEVLDMSALESGKFKINNEPFDIRKNTLSILQMFFSQAKNKDVHFETIPVEITNECLVGDSLRLNQILANLLSNAIKFTPRGGRVTLTIKQLVEKGDSAFFRFEVEDTGIGMDEAYLERLWVPFEQEDETIGTKYGGTGLGMPIVKMLTAIMNGKIEVESKKGIGTKFTLEIPFLIDHSMKKEVYGEFSSVRALVVDDEEDNCEYIHLLLKRCGIRNNFVTSGDKAVQMLCEAKNKKDPYQICFLDWKMPKQDGLETVKQIRREFPEDLCIVVVTAYDYSCIEAEAKKDGVTSIVPKPLFQSTVYDLLVNVFGEKYVEKVKSTPISGYDFHGNRILVAEDNQMNMEIITNMLQKVGFEVLCAENGKEAVALFESQEVGSLGVILMDVQMPIMDGYTATRQIRMLDKADAKTIPIFALTANAFKEDIAASLAAGMNEHISKPVDYKELYRVISKCIKNRNNQDD